MFYNLKEATVYCSHDCNLNCIYCKVKGMENYSGDINQNDTIIFTGGEPLLANDIPIRLASVSNKFKNIHLLSNLILLTDDVFDSIVSPKLTILTNLDSYRKDVYELITQTDTFESKIKNMDKVYSRIDDMSMFVISMVITKYNINHLVKHVDFILNRWPKADLLLRCLTFDNMDYDTAKSIAVPYRQIDNEIKSIRNTTTKFKTFMLPFCWSVLHEDQCIEHDITSKIYASPEEIKVYRADFPHNVFVTKCASCIHSNYCLGVHQMYIRIFGEEEFPGVNGYKIFK